MKQLKEVFAIQDERFINYSDENTAVEEKIAFTKAIANSPFHEYSKLK